MNLIDRVAVKVVRNMMKKKNVKDTDSIFELKKGVYNRIPVKGCVTSNGKQQIMFVWEGNEKDLMISFNGGGVAIKADDCTHPMDFKGVLTKATMLYAPDAEEVYEYAIFILAKDNGIVSPLPQNPFADWTKVMIPYVSGDFHTGTADQEYTDKDGSKKIMHMHGYTNFKEIIGQVRERWPNPERILITGSSAGSFGTSALASEICDLYPDCKNITVYCDSSYIPMDNWKEIVSEFWKAPEHIVAPLHTEDMCGDWLEALYRKHGERIKIVYTCSNEDCALAAFSQYEHGGKFEVSDEYRKIVKDGFRQRIARFEKDGIKVSNYVFAIPDKINGGTVHCISQDKKWSETKVDGISPAEWVMDAVNGKCCDVGLDLLK